MTKILNNKYELKDRVSEEVLFYIHLGVNCRTQQKVFVTRYKKELLTPKLTRKLMSFAETLLSLRHDNILSVLDYGYDGAALYVVHHFEEDLISLDAVLSRRKTWQSSKIKDIASQVLDALIAIEEAGLSFGNLSLSHIYLTRNGSVKLANILLPSIVLKTHRSELSILEEGLFFPPEFLHAGTISKKTDIYSVGVLFYFLFTCQWPSPFVRDVLSLKQALLKPLVPPSRQNPQLSSQLSDLIVKCMHLEPSQRFTSLKALKETFENQLPVESGDFDSERSPMRKNLLKDLKKHRVSQFRKRVSRLALIAVPTVVLFFAYQVYVGYLTEIPLTNVPNVVSLSFSEAQEIMNASNLTMIVVGERSHPMIPEGHIIETKPPASRQVKQSRPIRVFVSKGKSQIAVPELVGKQMDQAIFLLEEAGLRYQVSENVYSLDQPKDFVLAQLPTANEIISSEVTVNITLSSGFPLDLSISQPSGFFSNKDNRVVVVTLRVLEDWPTQDVSILHVQEGVNTPLFSESLGPDEERVLNFELPKNSAIEVYYNQELRLREDLE